MAERILNSLGILLAGLFQSEPATSASDSDRATPAPSEPPELPEAVKRTDSGVHRISG